MSKNGTPAGRIAGEHITYSGDHQPASVTRGSDEGSAAMSAPSCFTVERSSPSSPSEWRYDGPESDAVWLPRLGPTSWALLRLLDSGAPAGKRSVFTVATLASMIGTSPSRLWTSVDRLVQFDVLAVVGVRADAAFSLPLRLPELDWKQWRRLPDVVRLMHSDLAPASGPTPVERERRAG